MKRKLLLLLVALLAVGQNAFAYDFSYTYLGKTLFYTIQGNGVIVDNPTPGNYYTYVTGDVVIPDSVENGGTWYAVTSIGGAAFNGCSNLTTGLTSVTIGSSVTSIGDGAFYDCRVLTSVTIGSSVTSIGHGAFEYCSGLTSVTIGSSVTSIGNYAFYGCSSLTSVFIPNSVTSIAGSSFRGCSGLISVIIGDGVTNINSGAFEDCTSLTSVTIGSSVTSIGYSAFYNCSTLTEIVCRASVAPAVASNNAFSNVPSTIDVYIPCGSQMSYSSRWSYFSHFIEESGFSFSAQSADSLMGNVEIMTAPTCQVPQAVVNATANEGYRFDHWNDGSVVNPRSLTLTSDTALVAYFSLMTYDTVVVHDTTFVPVHDTTYITVHDTIYLPQYIYDTVYIHDTIYVGDNGVGEVDALNAKVYISQGQVVVEGADGNQVTLYDAAGRMLATKWDQYSLLRFDVPASGAYLIKIGDHPARKIVVVR